MPAPPKTSKATSTKSKTTKSSKQKPQKSFEATLFEAANNLRSNMDATEYKYIALGLIFLKSLDESFNALYTKLLDEGRGYHEEIDAYHAKGILYLPENARFSHLKALASSDRIGEALDAAMSAVEEANPSLKGVLPKGYAKSDINKAALGRVVMLFDNITLEGNDLLGKTYQYFLAEFATQSGKRGGEFYTPASIVELLVNVISPYKGRIYDPCCGSGGMFVHSVAFIHAHCGSRDDVAIYGQESNATTRKLALMNLALRGIECDLGAHAADTLHDDLHASNL